MPRLPTAADLGGPTPSAARPFTELRPAPVSNALGNAFLNVADMAAKEMQDLSAAQAQDALNQLKTARQDLTIGEKGFSHLREGDVIGGPDRPSPLVTYPEKFKQARERIAGALGNAYARKLFDQRAGQEETALRGDLLQHVSGESVKYQNRVSETALDGYTKDAINAPVDSLERVAALAQAKDAIKVYWDRNGGGEKVAAQAIGKMLSGVHEGTINLLLADEKDVAASTYFKKYGKEIDPTRRDEILSRLSTASTLNEGDRVAEDIFSRATTGKKYTEPLDRFVMEKEARAAFPNDAKRANAAITALRERVAAWNASQTEAVAGTTNEVFKMLDAGTPLSKVQGSKAWSELPGKVQHQIITQNESLLAARASRAAAVESRAASGEQRAFVAEQRAEKRLLLTNADQYLAFSDPASLSKRPRKEVEASRAIFGFDGAQHLLTKYDALQKPGAVLEATIDNDLFNSVADQMGLRPYKANTEEKRRELGNLKMRVERVIDQAQTDKGKKLTPTEKGALMRAELANAVVVDPGFLRPNRRVSVINLTPDDVEDVVVPEEEKPKITAALAEYNKRYPNDPRFAPTPENMRNLYLMGKGQFGVAAVQGQK